MQRLGWIVVALLGVLLVPASVSAQEPERGRFNVELGISTKGIWLKMFRSEPEGEAPAIDTMSPALLPTYLDVLMKHVGGMLSTRMNAGPDAVIATTDQGTAQAQRLFDMAETYRRLGLYGSARFYFQRVHSLQPTTPLGRLAIERLTEVEDRLRDAEESGNEDPDQVYRRMQQNTMPLGLVELTY